MSSRTAVFATIGLTIAGFLYFLRTPSSTPTNMPPNAATSTSGALPLSFRLSQISKNPPSLLVTLQNNHPSSTFTILKWGTPLDPQAQNLGVFKLSDFDTGKEIPTDIIKIARKMPPSRDDLLEIAPGTEHATEIILDKPWMPERKPAKYRVRVEGEFHGVWEKPAKEVGGDEVEAYTDSSFNGISFSNEPVVMVVE
jgi:hypothetical protein